jgi:hypothetical protein
VLSRSPRSSSTARSPTPRRTPSGRGRCTFSSIRSASSTPAPLRQAAAEDVCLPVAAVSDGTHSPSAVYINITVTDTLGGGYIVVRPSDPTGEKPLPPTSNVNWSTNGQTLANLAFVAIGDETYIEVHAGGAGSTHVIVDLQGYIPIPA